jgi:hydrogenase maturation protein HypF
MQTHKLTIKGTVQGVGFRPFIYTLAKRYNLNGTVSNGSNGVEIFINASKEVLEQFIETIQNELPSLAYINSLDIEKIAFKNFQDFQIIETKKSGEIRANIPPDISICKACEAELFDPNNRRYGYPFITCTHCGVRYSIIYDLPYDRVNTSTKFFEMCQSCKEEYNNPLDRRYHAQPIGCWDCGASLELVGRVAPIPTKIIDEIVALIKQGDILAIKGVGGYHLVCDATNEEAIQKLRDRKRRPTKPFAVMVRDIEMAKNIADINDIEEELLSSKERPIVLLESTGRHIGLPLRVAPNISRIGLFFPYTPLHLLILKKLNRPLVATSANITDEPICTNTKSIKKLSTIYDYLVDNNREIVNGCDDSVVMVVKNQTIFIRRARGYTPVSIKLPFKLDKKVLAVGANQKSTVAIGFDDQVILSPHIGDLDGIESVEYFKENIENLKRIYRFEPEVVVHDGHPNYESTKYAKNVGRDIALPLQGVQHHYAHILAVMAEKSLTQKVLGVAFDGTGYGDDGNLWGGEFMICDYEGYDRVAHINYFKLLGGAKAIKEPKRVALSLLFDIYGDKVLDFSESEALAPNKARLKPSIPTIQAFTPAELKTQYLMWQKALNAPLSSSAGRLFDAVASLTGVCQVMSFEGESGMMLEELYDDGITDSYPFAFEEGVIDILPMIEEVTQEQNSTIAISKFFNTLVEIIYIIHQQYPHLPLVLTGGVFQNRVLLGLVLERIPTAIVGNKIPPNDGGISLGQIVSTHLF